MPEASLANEPLTRLSGVGPSLAQKLERIGLASLQDLLFHLPARYEDRTRVTTIGEVRLGQNVVLEGRVISTDVTFGRRRSLQSGEETFALEQTTDSSMEAQQIGAADGRSERAAPQPSRCTCACPSY